MTIKRSYTQQFKDETVRLVLEFPGFRGHSH